MRVCVLFIMISGFVVSADAGPWPCNMGTGQVQCNDHGTCTHHPPGVPGLFCDCNPGWTGEECETDIDECAASPGPCDTNADCTDTDGSYTCACKAGYTGSGTVGDCTDVDECAASPGPCDTNADCTDTDGSYTCACKDGFTGSGTVGDCTALIIASCDGTVNSEDGALQSPNFPENYPNLADCTWLIPAGAGKIVQLNFINFNLEKQDDDFYEEYDYGGEECVFDSLTVYDGATASSTELGKFCGTTHPATLQSTGSDMFVAFKSDESVTRTGFKIGYSIMEP